MNLPRPKFRAWLVALVIFALGAGLSGVSYFYSSQAEERRIQDDFGRRVQSRVTALDSTIRSYNVVLESTRLLYRFSDDVKRSDLAGVFRQFQGRYPGLFALEWAPLVTRANRAAVEAGVRAEGFPDFVFRDRIGLEGAELQPAPEHEQYLPIIQGEPLALNHLALGFNILSGVTAPEIAIARATGRTVMSPRVRLFTPENNIQGFIVYLPVFAKAEPAGGPGEFRGVVAGVFRLDEVLAGMVKGSQDDNQVLEMLVVDDSVPAGGEVLGFVGPDGRIRVDQLPAEKSFVIPGTVWAPFPLWARNWELLFRPTPQWLAASHTHEPPQVLALGLLASGALALFVYGRARRSALIELQVGERTAQLRQAQVMLNEDILHRIETERALQASERRLQAVLEYSPSAIFLKDLEGRYVLVNRQYERTWGRIAGEILGRKDAELFPPEIAAAHRATDQQAFEASEAIKFEVTVRLPKATGPTTVLVQKFPLRDAAGRVYGICGISTDITERIQAEGELQENRRQLSNLISQLPGAAFRCAFDAKLTIHFASEGMLALTGYPAGDYLSGRVSITDLTVPADRPVIRDAVARGIRERRNFEAEYRIRHREGAEKWILVRGRPIYAVDGSLRFLEGLAIDVTALKNAETQKLAIERKLLEAQKLESLGVLAGGIAHDFNNILTAVLANASHARQLIEPTSPAGGSLQQIEIAARRAADLCQQMLAYAGKGKIATDRVNLSELVRGSASLLGVTLGKNTRLDLRLADGLPPVLVDVTQLRQIVMNLVINAADAIGEKAGVISATTFIQPAEAGLLRGALGHPDLPAGNYVGLEVTDNGSGMTPETIARIFEPFFTTKFSGRGLGLSAVLGIVQSHHGALFVESAPGRGSTFRLLLPATQGPAVSSGSPFPVAAAPTRLKGTVLIVDDEEAIRRIAAAVLESQGAVVAGAASGDEALKVLRAQGGKISLIVLDMTMPGLSGEETLRQIRQLDARQPVIIMSGYSEKQTMQRSANLGVAGFVQKPFEIEVLLAKVRPFLS